MIDLIKKLLKWRLFSRKDGVTDALAIVKWWEVRRIAFNLIVGFCGVATIAVILLVAALASEKFNEPLGPLDPPIVAIIGVIAYAVAANVCYTGGWIAELLVTKLWGEDGGAYWQISFVLGLAFFILLTLCPAFIFAGLLGIRLLLQ